MYMLVACNAKWPETLRGGLQVPVDVDSDPVTPDAMCELLVQALRFSHGRSMKVFHDQCTSARVYSMSGLVFFAKRVGLLQSLSDQTTEAVGPKKRRRSNAASSTGDEPSGGEETLRLGKWSQQYALVSDRKRAVDAISQMIGACPDVRWPESASDVRNFLNEILKATSKALGLPQDSYTVQSFIRKVCFLLPAKSF
jgi:hypothetical protein